MLKILEVHAASGGRGEYVALQNQGLMTLSLRGWALCTDAYLNGSAAQIVSEMYIFRDEIPLKPYTRVVLFTGRGEDGWVPTIDGKQAYCAYWGRDEGVWTRSDNVHVLHLLATKRVAPVAANALPAMT